MRGEIANIILCIKKKITAVSLAHDFLVACIDSELMRYFRTFRQKSARTNFDEFVQMRKTKRERNYLLTNSIKWLEIVVITPSYSS